MFYLAANHSSQIGSFQYMTLEEVVIDLQKNEIAALSQAIY